LITLTLSVSQIKFAISVLGCADYEKLLTYRSQLTEFSQDFDVSQSLRLLLSEYDPIYRIDRLAGKSILLLGGRKDELVPPFLNAQFIELANQKQIDCEEMIDVDAAHELSTRMNQKITEWLQKHF
jgi:predicted esterase